MSDTPKLTDVDQPAEWSDPLPLGWHTKAPAFPAGVFPPAVEQYVTALAEATQTPRDLPGTVALGILAACIGGKVDVQCPTWVEPTNLFVVPVMPPASRKSAVVAACRAPLAEAERQLRDDVGDQVHDTRTAWEVLHRRAEAAKGTAAKTGDPADMAEAQEAVREAEQAREQIVAWPRLSTDDATPEALVSLLCEQGGRIAAISAEAGVFASLAGRYTTKPNLDPVLKAHAGDEITVDRRSRDPEHVARPALTIVASIQPYALREMVDRGDYAGRGLLARPLWALPADNTGYRRVRDVGPVPDALTATYQALVVDLAKWAGAAKDTLPLKLDDEATEELLNYGERVERQLRPDGDLGEHELTRGWGGKLVGAVARIAGCLHAARGVATLDETISGETMRAAVTLGEYYRAHAVLALTPSDDRRTAAARVILGRLCDKGMGTFTVRELQRRVPRALQKADVLARLLDYLCDLDWVRPAGDGKGWQLHPRATECLKAADTADTADSPNETAGQRTCAPTPKGVSTTADTADTPVGADESVSGVSGTADTVPTPPAVPPTSANTPGVGGVSAVSTFAGSSTAHVWWAARKRPEHPDCQECEAAPGGPAHGAVA
ncbi:MAG TPA: YfjI family protein [Micromonospora sp.]|nr:YfjI family protein [Micromonospora sp.]